MRVMFLTLLMKQDPDHVVRKNFQKLVEAAKLDSDEDRSIELASDALKILSEPDLRSMKYAKLAGFQDYEGRRIQKVDDGWMILNGQKYQEEMMVLTARMRKTRLQREKRAADRKAAEEAPANAKRKKELMARSGKYADRLREQAIKDGDKQLENRLDEMEGKMSPGDIAFRENFKKVVDEEMAKQVHPLKPNLAEGPARPEGVGPGESFPEV